MTRSIPHLPFRRSTPGQVTAAPCPLQVVAAALTVHIQNLPGKIDPRRFPGLQRLRQLLQRYPSGAYLCAVIAVVPHYVNPPVSAQPVYLRYLLLIYYSNIFRHFQARQPRKQQHQLLMKHSRKEFLHRPLPLQKLPAGTQQSEILLRIIRQKINAHLHALPRRTLFRPEIRPEIFPAAPLSLRCLSNGRGLTSARQYVIHHPAQLEDRNPRNPLLRQLQLTPLLRHGYAFPEHCQPCLRPDTSHRLQILLPAFQLHQRRNRGNQAMPQLPGQLMPAAVRPCPGSRLAPTSQNHTVEGKYAALPPQFHPPCPPVPSNPLNPTVRHHFHTGSRHLIAQHVQHRRSLLTGRIEIAVPALYHQPYALEKGNRLHRAEPSQTIRQKSRAAGIIFLQIQLLVSQIALAVTGRQYLFAQSIVPFQ